MSGMVPYNDRHHPALREPQGSRPPGFEGYPEPETDDRGLKQYLLLIRRHLLLVMAVTIASGGFAAWRTYTAPPLYEATSVIRFADTRRALTGSDEDEAFSRVMGNESDILLSQIQVLMSRQNVGRVVDAEGLRLVPAEGQPHLEEITAVTVDSGASADSLSILFGDEAVSVRSDGESVTAPYGSPLSIGGVQLTVTSRPETESATYAVISRNEAIGSLLGSFRATPRPQTDVIDLKFIAPDPYLAERVANAMARTFQQRNTESAQQTSFRRRVFLEEQIRQTTAMLERAMGAYSSFRSGQQVFSSRMKATAQETGIVEVELRRAELDAQRRAYNALLAQSQRSAEGFEAGLRALVSSPGIAVNPVIQQLYRQLTALETQRDSLTTLGAASTHPDLVAIGTLISSTSGRLMAAVRNQVQALDAQIEALDDLKTRSTASIASAPVTETEEARLAQQVQAIQGISDQLQEDYQKARMSEAVEAGQVEIIDLADRPGGPTSDGQTRKIALGLIMGAMLGTGLAVLLDGMNTSIRRRDDIERHFQVPGLAVIPQFPVARLTKRLATTVSRKSRNGTGGKLRADRKTGLVTVYEGQSAGAEAFRTLRTNIIFSQAVQELRTLVVTSAAPAEGKTTTAANLAVSFAQQGMRVLIVDCDLRRSRLHKMFSIPREPGLTEFILGRLDQEAVVRTTPVTGLYVLPSGQLPPNPAELLGGTKMRDALTALGGSFDLIILDTPPLLAAADAAVLGTIVDGVVLVVRAGVTEIEAGKQAMQQLTAVGARVVGAVLNDPDAKVAKYGGYYKYEYASE